MVGFKPFQYEGEEVNTLRVFVSYNKKSKVKHVTVYIWIAGDTYDVSIDESLVEEVEKIVKSTGFYSKVGK